MHPDGPHNQSGVCIAYNHQGVHLITVHKHRLSGVQLVHTSLF